jgi:uncharacterized protein YbbC (DUF1343 family)
LLEGTNLSKGAGRRVPSKRSARRGSIGRRLAATLNERELPAAFSGRFFLCPLSINSPVNLAGAVFVHVIDRQHFNRFAVMWS